MGETDARLPSRPRLVATADGLSDSHASHMRWKRLNVVGSCRIESMWWSTGGEEWAMQAYGARIWDLGT